MERSIISWNIPNFISVCLMALVGFLVAGLVTQMLKGNMPNFSRANTSTVSTGGEMETGTGGF